MDAPKIVNVDDHVVEPAHVWQTWLPEQHREAGPRIERKRWGPFVHHAGAQYTNVEYPEGDRSDEWYSEQRLVYVHKKFVARSRKTCSTSHPYVPSATALAAHASMLWCVHGLGARSG